MKEIGYFFECYYYITPNRREKLDEIISNFVQAESIENQRKLIEELKKVIVQNKYEEVSSILKRKFGIKFSTGKTELILKYIYAKLCKQPTEITLDELIKRLKK